MRPIIFAAFGLLALVIGAATPAAAQFYGPGYGGYGGPAYGPYGGDPYYGGYRRAPRAHGFYGGGGYLGAPVGPRTRRPHRAGPAVPRRRGRREPIAGSLVVV